ncbi:MAG TPA: hypothetical protein VGE50_07545 [Gammaproteobacteria bacterium]
MLSIEGSRYSLMEIDNYGFLLPGREVIHIGLRETIVRAADTSGGIIGHVPVQLAQLPLYVPSGRLGLLDYLPEERRFAACLSSGAKEVAIACDAIRPFTPSANHLRQPLPTVQAVRNSPLKELLLDEQRLYFVTDTLALFAYLSTQPIDIYEPESTSLVAEG